MVPVLFLYELMLMHAQREGSFSPQGIGEQALEQYARFCQVKSRGDAVRRSIWGQHCGAEADALLLL